ncbi:MAG: phytoene/squalene synthase family protein [Saprospiraceae bacterium]|nr:phytoene/squalene synthase family protein [Bacteroidia bacterium]NNL93519.1 phytoene/squalene synthase family protein [Saprospiraceae bacterium]
MSASLYSNVCKECSKLITNRYSTSFSLGIKLFDKKFRSPIYSIYGFVRFADEIVDTFHDYDKKELLVQFRKDTYAAIRMKLSLNPVLNAFQEVVNEYSIEIDLIDAFLDSMAMDLQDLKYDVELYKKYIYGSAEVVGLMCLRVFLKDKGEEYEKLKPYAMSLGSAFQKINFLRDIKDDYFEKGRLYFPNVDPGNFDDGDKKKIEEDIALDFKNGLKGILLLPKGAKFGVYIAYIFYYNLFKKIEKLKIDSILQERVRIKNRKKAYLLAKYSLKNSLNLI